MMDQAMNVARSKQMPIPGPQFGGGSSDLAAAQAALAEAARSIREPTMLTSPKSGGMPPMPGMGGGVGGGPMGCGGTSMGIGGSGMSSSMSGVAPPGLGNNSTGGAGGMPNQFASVGPPGLGGGCGGGGCGGGACGGQGGLGNMGMGSGLSGTLPAGGNLGNPNSFGGGMGMGNNIPGGGSQGNSWGHGGGGGCQNFNNFMQSSPQHNMMQPNGMHHSNFGGRGGPIQGNPMQQNQMYRPNQGPPNMMGQVPNNMHNQNMMQPGNMMPTPGMVQQPSNFPQNGMGQNGMMQNNFMQQQQGANRMPSNYRPFNNQQQGMHQNMMQPGQMQQDGPLPQHLLQQAADQSMGQMGKGGMGQQVGGMAFQGQMASQGGVAPMGGMGGKGACGGGYQPTAGVGFLLGEKKLGADPAKAPPPPPPQQIGKGPIPPPPPPPPPPPAEPSATTRPAPPAEPAVATPPISTTRDSRNDPEFVVRFNSLKEKWPAVDVPVEVWTWSVQELDEFYESGGMKRPKHADRKPNTPRKRKAGEALGYSVQEALELQRQLHDGFADAPFQDSLKRLQVRYPNRKTKGHKDGPSFFEAFESLTLSVHARVLPEWHLTPDWDGVREMISRMKEALRHPKVKKTQEEINMLMGLPRDATFKPPSKGEEIFAYRPNRDGNVPGYSRDLLLDEDGDEGHEFLVEDLATGELRPTGPSAIGDNGEIWYRVLHKPAVVIRAKPDVKSDMIGRKKTGKKMRVAKVHGEKWLQLHHSEVQVLGAQEGWVLLDGAEQGLAGQKLLERVL